MESKKGTPFACEKCFKYEFSLCRISAMESDSAAMNISSLSSVYEREHKGERTNHRAISHIFRTNSVKSHVLPRFQGKISEEIAASPAD